MDQWFGELAKWVRRRLSTADHPDDFVKSLDEFQRKEPRRYEPEHYAFKLDQIRDWKSWVAQVPQKLTGIAGPAAPHLFQFRQRRGLTAKRTKNGCFALFLSFACLFCCLLSR